MSSAGALGGRPPPNDFRASALSSSLSFPSPSLSNFFRIASRLGGAPLYGAGFLSLLAGLSSAQSPPSANARVKLMMSIFFMGFMIGCSLISRKPIVNGLADNML